MGGAFYLFSMVCLLFIIRWLVKNDKNAPGQPDTGWLAMKDEKTVRGRERGRGS